MAKTIEISYELYEDLRDTIRKEIEEIQEFIKKTDNQTNSSVGEIEERMRGLNTAIKKLTLLRELELAREHKPELPESQKFFLEEEPLSDNIIHLEYIKQITNRELSRILLNGAIIRFRFREENYETQINDLNYKYATLNSIFIKKFKAWVNIWRDVEIYFKDEKGWHPLTILRG